MQTYTHTPCFSWHCEWRAVAFTTRPVIASQKGVGGKIKTEEERTNALWKECFAMTSFFMRFKVTALQL